MGRVYDEDPAREPAIVCIIQSLDVLCQGGFLFVEGFIEYEEVFTGLRVCSFNFKLAPSAVESSIDVNKAAEAWYESLLVSLPNKEVGICKSLTRALGLALDASMVFQNHVGEVTSAITRWSAAATSFVTVIVLFLKVIMNALKALSVIIDCLDPGWKNGV